MPSRTFAALLTLCAERPAMNVLVVSPMVPNRLGTSAGAIVMHGEVQAIAQRHDVTLATLATPNDDDALRSLRDDGFRVHAVFRQRDRGPLALVRRVSIGLRSRVDDVPLRTAVFHERSLQRVLDRLSVTPFDVVHVFDNAMASYRLPPSRSRILTELEVRVTAEDGIVAAPSDGNARENESERERWWRYQAHVWAQFDRVQVYTNDDAEAARRIAPIVADRVRVNPFGVHARDIPSATAERPGAIVFVGGFRHPPNVDAALWLSDEIFPLVHAQHPDAQLSIVGADPPESLRARASESVHVVGQVDDVEPYVESAAVVVAPMRSGGGMRLKVLQAMAAARPVVTTSRGSAGIWNLASAPTLLIAEDAEGIAEHISKLLASTEARHTLGARARSAVLAHHRWDQFAERLHAIYDEIAPASTVA